MILRENKNRIWTYDLFILFFFDPVQTAEEEYRLELRHSCLWARITDMNYDPRLQVRYKH